MSSKTALITGATVGIGAAFAEHLAKLGHDLVIVARDEAKLQERAESWSAQYNVHVEPLRADLSLASDLAKVEKLLHNSKIDVLINNAGFGINKSFLVSSIDDEDALLEVLVRAPMRLSHAVLPAMMARKEGIIINVSSVAGWIAGGSYSAAKSYLTVLTESLDRELRGTGVQIHALCPGFTRTEFHQRGRMRMAGLPKFMWLSAERVVAEAWKSAAKGEVISVPGWPYKILSSFSRFGPRPLVRKLGMNIRIRQRQK
jgi:short-subunit dehydrogenase